jgi:hypothetical protein
MRHIAACLSIVLPAMAACAPQPQSPRAAPPRSILFVGNSYSFDVPAALRRSAARHGRTIHVGQVTRPGWTLARHAANPETLETIRSGSWDMVVLQEQSRIPSLPAARTLRMNPSVARLTAAARAAGAEPVLYQTWGRRDGDPKTPGDDFAAMNQRVRRGYQAAARHAGGLRIVPVGDAWEREAAAGRLHTLYQPDGSHPSRAGVRLAAETFRRELLP